MTDDSGFYSIEYARIVPVLVEAMKQQQQIIDTMRTQMNSLTAFCCSSPAARKASDTSNHGVSAVSTSIGKYTINGTENQEGFSNPSVLTSITLEHTYPQNTVSPTPLFAIQLQKSGTKYGALNTLKSKLTLYNLDLAFLKP